MSERDTQFQGFAKMLTNELIKYLTSRSGLTLDEIEQEWHKVITRRAYDLVCHAAYELKSLGAFEAGEYMDDYGYFAEDIMSPIPDMTELPDTMHLVDLGGSHGASHLEVLNEE